MPRQELSCSGVPVEVAPPVRAPPAFGRASGGIGVPARRRTGGRGVVLRRRAHGADPSVVVRVASSFGGGRRHVLDDTSVRLLTPSRESPLRATSLGLCARSGGCRGRR